MASGVIAIHDSFTTFEQRQVVSSWFPINAERDLAFRVEIANLLRLGEYFAPSKLLHVCDLYDTALCLRVLWILHHSHVQFFLAFTEGYVCCAITRGDLKYV